MTYGTTKINSMAVRCTLQRSQTARIRCKATACVHGLLVLTDKQRAKRVTEFMACRVSEDMNDTKEPGDLSNVHPLILGYHYCGITNRS